MIKDPNSTLVRRHEELLHLVDTKGKISVDELARYLGVSDDTIRRDLQNLEQRKLLLRTHGGAISIVLLAQETPFLNRTNANAGAKSRIGRAAAKLISDGETLIVNGGSTTFPFAANLRTAF
jgi:DeoR family transcriptional regulator, fructose operon transcriptional repressor